MEGQGFSMGSLDNPFFDLLQPSVPAPSPSPSIVRSSSSHGLSSPKKEDNPYSDFIIGQDDVLPGYDFHPVRNNGVSGNSSKATSSILTARHEESIVKGNIRRQSSPPQPSYASADPPVYRTHEPPITYESSIQRHDELKDSLETATTAAVERTMKKYVDDLLRVLEGMSGRLLQLENSTQRLEHSVQILKADAANNHGESDGKLRMLENLIKEVQGGVQTLRDKQEISDAHSQLVKLQLVKSEEAPASTSAPASVDLPMKLLNISGPQQSELPVQQSHVVSQQLPAGPQIPVVLQQPPEPLQGQPSFLQTPATPQVPHNIQHQQLPALPAPPVIQNHPSQLPGLQSQSLAYPNSSLVPPPSPAPAPSQPYAPPPHPQQQPPHSLQMQSYNQPPHIQQQFVHQPEVNSFTKIAQASQPQGLHPPPQGPQAQRTQPPTVCHPSETFYPQTATQGPPPQPQPYQILPQQHRVSVQQVYDPSFGRSNSGQLTLPSPYGSQAQPIQASPMYEAQALAPSSAYSNPNYRVAQPLLPTPGGGSYPRLPVAQPLQQSLPHTPVGSGLPLPQTRVPADDVVERVATMGFPREQVQAVVRRLIESGQSAELNVVLDKLMNGGEAPQPQRGWFNR